MAMSDLLNGCPLFFELYESEIERIAKHCAVFEFNPGEFIIKDGDEGEEIYIILVGRAMVQKNTERGIVRIQPLTKGDVFGEMVLVDENKRSADIVAETKVHLLEMKFETIFNLFKTEPRIFGLVQLNLSRMIAKRLRESNNIIKEIREKLL